MNQISDFQFYSNARSSAIKLVKCWPSKSTKTVRIVFQFCYLYLHFNSNIFSFPELSASTNFFPKEDMFPQIATESLEAGKLLQFLGICTVKEKDWHTLQTSQSLFTSQKDCQRTKSVISSGISAHGVHVCSHKSYVWKPAVS